MRRGAPAAVRRRADAGFHRAGIHRLGGSVGGGMTASPRRRIDRYCARSCCSAGQRASASAGSAPDRRRRRRGCPRGRTDRAAVPRSARTADCRRPSRRAPDRPGRSRRTGGRRSRDGRERTPGCPRCGSARPRRPARRLELRQARHRAAIDEIGDGVEALDGQPGEAVHHHPLGGGGLGRGRRQAAAPQAPRTGLPDAADQGYSGAKAGSDRLPFLSCRCAVIVDADNIRVGGHWAQPTAVPVSIRLRRRPGFDTRGTFMTFASRLAAVALAALMGWMVPASAQQPPPPQPPPIRRSRRSRQPPQLPPPQRQPARTPTGRTNWSAPATGSSAMFRADSPR